MYRLDAPTEDPFASIDNDPLCSEVTCHDDPNTLTTLHLPSIEIKVCRIPDYEEENNLSDFSFRKNKNGCIKSKKKYVSEDVMEDKPYKKNGKKTGSLKIIFNGACGETKDSRMSSEEVCIELDPEIYFPNERKPKMKSYTKALHRPYICELCGKSFVSDVGVRSHSLQRHGVVARSGAVACPACPAVLAARTHKAHLDAHGSRLPCQYCMPVPDTRNDTIEEILNMDEISPNEKKYSAELKPSWWFKDEKSLQKHKKKSHPYSGTFGINWFCQWGDR